MRWGPDCTGLSPLLPPAIVCFGVARTVLPRAVCTATTVRASLVNCIGNFVWRRLRPLAVDHPKALQTVLTVKWFESAHFTLSPVQLRNC